MVSQKKVELTVNRLTINAPDDKIFTDIKINHNKNLLKLCAFNSIKEENSLDDAIQSRHNLYPEHHVKPLEPLIFKIGDTIQLTGKYTGKLPRGFIKGFKYPFICSFIGPATIL